MAKLFTLKFQCDSKSRLKIYFLSVNFVNLMSLDMNGIIFHYF